MKRIAIFSFIFVGVILFLRFIVGGNEDLWICNDQGQWVKHGNPNYPSPVAGCGKITPLPRNQNDCLKQGGVWRKQGPEPFASCNRKAIDRGNLCRDNSECEGWCQVELNREELRQGMSGKVGTTHQYGQCSVWVVELGCFGMMEQGETRVICID